MKTEINFLKGQLKSCRHFKDSSVHSEKGTRGGKKTFFSFNFSSGKFHSSSVKTNLNNFYVKLFFMQSHKFHHG